MKVGRCQKNTTMHNEAKSPSRVHFWDLCNIYDFKPIFVVFYAWRPQNNTQSDVDHYLLSFPNVKFENG